MAARLALLQGLRQPDRRGHALLVRHLLHTSASTWPQAAQGPEVLPLKLLDSQPFGAQHALARRPYGNRRARAF